MDLADLIGAPSIEQDTLRRRGLARVDVGDDPNISYLIELELAWHTGSHSSCYLD